MSGPFDALSDEERDALEERDHPDWLDPMLATLTHDHFSDPDWIYVDLERSPAPPPLPRPALGQGR